MDQYPLPLTAMDPTAVPLPPSDDTHYYTSSVKNSSPFRGGEEEDEGEDDYESQQPTIRPTPIHRRGALTDVFDTDTPVVSAAFNPFRTPHVLVDDDEYQNTPRPPRRGGKYHPGARHHQNRHSVASCSEAELADRSDTEDMDTDEPDDGCEDDLDGREDMDRTIAINLDSSVAQQLGTHPSSVRPRSRRSSPGRTPARKARAFAPSLASIKTPRALSHSSVPTSLFANTQNTPFLSATSPQKLNALQPLANNTPRSLSYHDMLQAKEDEIRQLKEILAVTDGQQQQQQQQQFQDFIDFSPEKRMGEMPASAELTVKKRRSPRKHAQPDASPVAPVGAPLKPMGVFEGIAKPITAEERKRARRRRVTQEFREFSAIDLNSLKESIFFPQPPVIEESEEVAEAQCQEEEGGGDEETNINPVEDASEQPIKEEDEEEVRVGTEEAGDAVDKELEEEEEEEEEREEKEGEEEGEEEAGDGTRSLIVPPLNRTRQYRSSSAPPVPHAPEDMAANTFNKFSAPTTTTPMDVDTAHDLEVARLNQTITELWDKLETADVQIERLKKELVGERKLKINAERACEFLEMERKFGVCCQYNPGSQPAKEKLGPAAVQLPNSSPPPPPPHRAPPVEENRRPVRPKSRLGGPATSNRPATRLGGERPTERPPTRLGGHGARNPAPAPVPAPATKKRTREELPVPPGKRAAAGRPEKRVLSGSAAANIMLGSSTSNTASSLAKKPEKAKAVGRGTRSVAGAAPVTRAGVLSRGARR